jgi:predicted nucleic acid-binding protein
VRFWDSSGIVALHVESQLTSDVRELYARDPQVLAWILSDVEAASALHRLAREGAMAQAEVQEAISRLDAFWETVHVVSRVDAVKLRARRLLGLHRLRAADALQLGAALSSVQDQPAGWEFICLDQRLGGAARLEGFTVLP